MTSWKFVLNKSMTWWTNFLRFVYFLLCFSVYNSFSSSFKFLVFFLFFIFFFNFVSRKTISNVQQTCKHIYSICIIICEYTWYWLREFKIIQNYFTLVVWIEYTSLFIHQCWITFFWLKDKKLIKYKFHLYTKFAVKA